MTLAQLRFKIVLKAARQVFEDDGVARAWLDERSVPLGDVTPSSLLTTDEGMELVMRELGRIDHGLPV